jgi:hypothetical protein
MRRRIRTFSGRELQFAVGESMPLSDFDLINEVGSGRA